MTDVVTRFFPNLYRDSVALMQLSARLARLPGVAQASAQMATRANLELMKSAGVLDSVPEPRPNDIFLVLSGEADAVDDALRTAAGWLDEKAARGDEEAQQEPLRSIQMAIERAGANEGETEGQAANLALISTPGDYAAAEAMKALRLGLNVMIFSDNVSVEAEVALKRYARQRNLLVMGPDCGTSIINGIPLAFANVVKRGDIGLIGASGTGLQQVSCLIDHYGGGITHAIGTGGHDLSAAVGGLTMLTAFEQLAGDPATRVIVLVSKPPAAVVAETLLRAAQHCGKPVVVCFLGASADSIRAFALTPADTLEDAARQAVRLSPSASAMAGADAPEASDRAQRARRLAAQLRPEQRHLRGLYTGGTFCYEAVLMLQEALPGLRSNTPAGSVGRIADVWTSHSDTLLDLGDDEFTRGRPHPMIDPGLRNERLLAEAADPGVAIVLLDFVLGYGAHPDPAGQIVPALRAARQAASHAGRTVLFIGHVCGTDGDPQGLAEQCQTLAAAGVELAASNAGAVALCRAVLEAARAPRSGD